MNCFDLMPAPRRRAKACRARLRQWIPPALAYAGMLVIICITCHRTWGVGSDPLADEIRQTKDRISSSGEIIEGLHKQLVASRWKLDTCRGVGRQPDWSVMLRLLSDGLGNEIVLKNCELSEITIDAGGKPVGDAKAGNSVSEPLAKDNKQLAFELGVAGFGRSQTAVSQFVLRLERSGMFDSVRLVSTSRQPFMNTKAVAFRLRCTLEGTGGTKR